jgi:hypothetical protein
MKGSGGRVSILAALFISCAPAQAPIPEENALAISTAMDRGLRGDPLACRAEPFKPFLDFAFRFEMGYVVRCSLKQFGGVESQLKFITRVRPNGGPPVVLADAFRIPAITPEIQKNLNLLHFRGEVEFSGVFAAGEGEYPVDLVVVDDRSRIYRKSWTAKALPKGAEKKATFALAPGSIAALRLPEWRAASTAPATLRLTVLLDASPINPYALKLRAWDRAFLLDSLSSLISQVPSASVRLIAFNLDQQREIFRQEQLDRSTFSKLSAALRNLELGTVSYRILQRPEGWANLLVKLAADEINAKPLADAVIFLGPNTRLNQKIPRELLGPTLAGLPQIFYFEYFPFAGIEFPDVIHHLTSDFKGKVFKLHSPGDLAENIRKLQQQLSDRNGPAAATARP